MKCILFLNLCLNICYSTSEFIPVPRLTKSPCENPSKNTLVEHFFNTIFTEFYTTPPVCVCVQMCIGQSTYCYPNGCLKTTISEGQEAIGTVDATPQLQKNQFPFSKGDKYDFMTDFLERNYVDDSKAQKIPNNPVQGMRPDPFKDKYSILGKYKKLPKVELRYNLQEKVRNSKADLVKLEGWTKTRWPMNGNRISAHKLLTDVEKSVKNQGSYFTAMLHDNEIVEYPPKYFKRDLTKIVDDDDVNILKAFYVLENSFNETDGKKMTLETLIDNLIRSSFGTNETNDATTISPINKNETETEIKATKEQDISVNSTVLANDTTRVISMNFTNENVDKNKYADETPQKNKTANVKEMITYLAKQIEIQNNTSMEIAKRTISDFNEATLKAVDDENEQLNKTTFYVTESTVVNNFVKPESTVSTIYSEPETTTAQEILVTKKNRQKVVKKFASSKINYQL